MSKKIAILSCVNIKHMSLISLYTSILKRNNVPYDIIYMDKYGEDEDFDCANKYRFVNIVNQKWPSFLKKIKYSFFYFYATGVLKRNKYDFIIVWNDLAIFMFANYLKNNYAGRYCLNVRDNMYYDRERYNKMYYNVFSKSAFNTISSKGFLDILPKGCSYIPINSLNLSVLEGMKIHSGLRSKTEPIRIGFVGYVRFYERNKKLLDLFCNDPRFELHYYGKNANVLKIYAEEKDIKNAVFHDSFPVKDTSKFMEKIDVINNLYGNETLDLRKAISIKFFHALYARIPILVNTKTYIGEIATSLGIGYYFDEFTPENKEAFYNWYHSIDFAKMDITAAHFLSEAQEENMNFERIVIEKICK